MLVSWFLLVHTCLTYDTMYVLSNYKLLLLPLLNLFTRPSVSSLNWNLEINVLGGQLRHFSSTCSAM